MESGRIGHAQDWEREWILLLSITGISLVVAAALVAAIGDISRFSKGKEPASYFGLVPSTYQSGDSAGYHGRITKRGRSQARWLLIEAAEGLRNRRPSWTASLEESQLYFLVRLSVEVP